MKNKPIKNNISKAVITGLFIVGLMLSALMAYNTSFTKYGVYNDTARLVYANTATAITKNNSDFPDGIYSGSLCEKRNYYPDISSCTDHSDYLDKALKNLMGTNNKGGYYCVVIKNDLPIAAYWSISSFTAEYSEQLGIMAQKNITDNNGTIYGYKFGVYPFGNFGNDTISLDHTGNSLPLYSNFDTEKSFIHKLLKIPCDSGGDIRHHYFDITEFFRSMVTFSMIIILPAFLITRIVRTVSKRNRENK